MVHHFSKFETAHTKLQNQLPINSSIYDHVMQSKMLSRDTKCSEKWCQNIQRACST